LLALLNNAIRCEYVVGVYLPADASGKLLEFSVRMKNPSQGHVQGGRRLVRQ
jgi:hypothetical protein